MSVTLKLVGTGIVMGIVHVLTGPDHLSAIATLSANVGNFRSFWYGVRWGIGHSIGLIVVGSIFIILSSDKNHDRHVNVDDDETSKTTVDIPPLVESIGETFVGFFMLALGFYSMYKVWKKIQCYNIVRDNDDDQEEEVEVDGTIGERIIQKHDSHGQGYHVTLDDVKNQDNFANVTTTTAAAATTVTVTNNTERNVVEGYERTVMVPGRFHEERGDKNRKDHGSISMIDMTVMDIEGHGHTLGHLHDHEHDHTLDSYGATLHHDHEHLHHYHHHHHHRHHPLMHSKGGLSKQFLSICIGIVHGIAGPGGVLGVIPAVELHNIWLSIVYLGSFCITSILVMGCFAAFYGMCSSRLSQSSHLVEIRMEIFSSSLSILVGSLWLILISVGKLHDVFP